MCAGLEELSALCFYCGKSCRASGWEAKRTEKGYCCAKFENAPRNKDNVTLTQVRQPATACVPKDQSPNASFECNEWRPSGGVADWFSCVRTQLLALATDGDRVDTCAAEAKVAALMASRTIV